MNSTVLNRQVFFLSFFKKNIFFIIILIAGLLALIYYSIGVNSWKFAFIGDEWPFYDFAKTLAEKNLLVNPFDLKGVYLDNPVTVSLYQAVFLKIFGNSHIIWRFSNLFLIFPLSIFFYLYVKNIFNSRIAFLSTLFLQCSFYITNFFKIGKPIPPSLILFVISLYLISYCYKYRMNLTILSLLGIILGISFYIYIGPIFPLILYPYFIITLFKKYSLKKILVSLLYVSIVITILLLPTLYTLAFDKTYIEMVTKKTIIKKEFEGNFQILINIFHNFILFYKNFDRQNNHFVSGPYLEIITRIFATIGIIITILKSNKREYFSILFLFTSVAFLFGLFSPYYYTPATRGIFFLPFGFILAGITGDIVLKKFGWKVMIGIIILVFLSNMYRSQIAVFNETGYHTTSLIIKELQESLIKKVPKPIIFISSSFKNYNTDNILYLQKIYMLSSIPLRILHNVSEINCKNLQNSTVLLLKEDKRVIYKVNRLNCNNTTIKILTDYYIY